MTLLDPYPSPSSLRWGPPPTVEQCVHETAVWLDTTHPDYATRIAVDDTDRGRAPRRFLLRIRPVPVVGETPPREGGDIYARVQAQSGFGPVYQNISPEMYQHDQDHAWLTVRYTAILDLTYGGSLGAPRSALSRIAQKIADGETLTFHIDQDLRGPTTMGWTRADGVVPGSLETAPYVPQGLSLEDGEGATPSS